MEFSERRERIGNLSKEIGRKLSQIEEYNQYLQGEDLDETTPPFTQSIPMKEFDGWEINREIENAGESIEEDIPSPDVDLFPYGLNTVEITDEKGEPLVLRVLIDDINLFTENFRKMLDEYVMKGSLEESDALDVELAFSRLFIELIETMLDEQIDLNDRFEIFYFATRKIPEIQEKEKYHRAIESIPLYLSMLEAVNALKDGYQEYFHELFSFGIETDSGVWREVYETYHRMQKYETIRSHDDAELYSIHVKSMVDLITRLMERAKEDKENEQRDVYLRRIAEHLARAIYQTQRNLETWKQTNRRKLGGAERVFLEHLAIELNSLQYTLRESLEKFSN